MSWKKIVLVVVVILAAILFWPRSAHYVNYPPTATGPWVAFGDSLTEGFGASEGHDYPTVLGKSLALPITNLGRSGETSTDGLKRIEEVAALHPRVVLLCFGGNDTLNGQSQATTIANLRTMLERFQKEGSFVVLIGIRSASLRDRNENSFKQLAKETQVFHVPDLLEGLAFKPVYMSDAVHPNDEGYRRFAERMEKKLKPLLKELRPASGAGT